LDAVGCSFALLRRACWPALEECYEESLRVNSELQCVEKSFQSDLITGLICVLDLCDGWCLVGVPISKIFVSLVA
jgi:hypothetical protein